MRQCLVLFLFPRYVVTLCSLIFKTDKNAYGSVSIPSTLTVDPSRGCERIRSASADMSNNCASLSRSCRNNVLRPWKSTSALGSNHSNSTFTSSTSCSVNKWLVYKILKFIVPGENPTYRVASAVVLISHGDIIVIILEVLALRHFIYLSCESTSWVVRWPWTNFDIQSTVTKNFQSYLAVRRGSCCILSEYGNPYQPLSIVYPNW